MNLTPRFTTVDKAVLISTGNSLVVCGSSSATEVTTSDMIMINGQTTRDWTQAGSAANINILSNSTILYAELVWYSTVASNVQGALDVRSIQDNAITLTTPTGINIDVTPQNTENYTGASQSVNRFRSADVTLIIKQYGKGTYKVSNVPTSIPQSGLSDTRAGWTLVVVYRNDIFPPQKIGLATGIVFATNTQPYQATISGFTTESDPKYLKADLLLVAANGGPLTGTETVTAGPSFANLTTIGNNVASPNPNPLTAPNNPYNNIFSGQINVCDVLSSSMGLIDINGTNGNNNNDAFVPTQVSGARNKWDMTAIDISNTLVPNQTLLAGEFKTTGDSNIQLLALGTQVKTNAPNITATLTAYDTHKEGLEIVEIGEEVIYIVKVRNDGEMAGNNLILSMNLGNNASFVPNSLTLNNVIQNGADISNGVNIGSISPYSVETISFAIRINSLPPVDTSTGDHLMSSIVNYNYEFVSGISNIVNYATTNKIQLIVKNAQLSIVKNVSKLNAIVGETLNYTTVITNTGTEIAKNMFFQDVIEIYTTFVSRSVTIDGIEMVDFNPIDGFLLQDLAPNASVTVIFSVTVNALSASTLIKNISNISFSYAYQQYNTTMRKTLFSNVVSVQLQYSDIVGKRCTNNNYPKVGDTVTYTLGLTNIGNVPALDVQVLEPSIPGATFVDGSVKINNVIQSNLNPFTGFVLSNPINPNTTTNISYDMLINTVKPGDTIQNTAQVPFKYQITPEQGEISEEKNSNTVETVANFVCMSMVESVDKAYATVDDILYYKVVIENNGNIDAYNTIFSSAIQTESEFIPGSVAINGIPYASYNPNNGFSVGTICSEGLVEVTYKAKVLTVPNPNTILNQSSLVYNYLPDPTGQPLSGNIASNTVSTIINKASYTISKSVDKAYAVVGETIVYTTTIKNTGTVVLTDIIFGDNISAFSEFYPSTVYINGINYPNYNPDQGFTLEDLHPGDTDVIAFAVTIKSTPSFGYVLNTSMATLSYIVNPNTPIITKTIYSNEVKTFVVTGNLLVTKSTNKAYAKVGDTISYSFNVSNIGNVPLTNVNFVDTVQAAATFVPGSVSVNGMPKPSYDPNLGFVLGDLKVSQVYSVTFDVVVNSVPNPNIIVNNATSSYSFVIHPTQGLITQTKTSNNVTTIINKGDATLTKAVDKLYASLNDILTYTVTAINTGTVALKNINLIDAIQPGATFVEDSVYINGINKPGYNPNTGFSVQDITPNGDAIIIFKAKVTSLPVPPQIKNTAQMTYDYYIDPNGTPIYDSRSSNTTTTNITTSTVTNTKSVDKIYATIGDKLTYTSVIYNSGNVDITNTNFIDTVPDNTSFVAGSVTINGTEYSNYNPNTGFTLGTINPGNSVTVVFKVNVESLPSLGYVTNQSNVQYNYRLNLDNPDVITANALSNIVTTYINVGAMTVTKAANRAYAKINDTINYSFNIVNTGNTILKNVSFIDAIQAESSFNINSVYVNGVNKPSYNPNAGFVLDDIQIGSYATVTFSVDVDSIPQPNGELLNSGSVTFSYYVDPNASIKTHTTISNTTTVYVKDTIVSATKTVDKAIAKILDTLNFTITVSNSGNVPIENVNFKDILDSNILFTPESVYINDIQYTSYNPNTGFALPNIQPQNTTTVKFATTIQTRPANNIVYNFATIDYDYTIDGNVIVGSMQTNTTQTYVATGELTVTKEVDKMYATINDILGYTVIVNNTGSVDATNISLQDLIASDASLVEGSVVVDGVSQPTLNPNTGFALDNLTPNANHVVTFSVKVNSVPSSGKIVNSADITFTYKLTPTDNPVTKTTPSNSVTTYINLGKLALTKVVDKSYATVNDILNYTINVTNQGNVICSNVIFTDIIQDNASFVSGSVMINDVVKPSFNPNTGFALPDINSQQTVIVKFAVKVDTVPQNYNIYNSASASYKYYINPNGNPVSTTANSNTVTTIINLGLLSVTKLVNKAYATLGDTVSYTINIVNIGNVDATNVNFRDVIPNGLSFVPNTVNINGIDYPGYNPYQSFSIGTMLPGDALTVKFDTTVSSIPNPSLVENIANVTFSYKIDPSGVVIVKQIDSNKVTTQINLGAISITKAVDKRYATHGDIITYSFTISNTGNVDAYNVVFLDDLQSDVTFNIGSVIVNNNPEPTFDPTLGFNLGTISTLNSVSVSFKVTVIAQPTQSSLLNHATGTFEYKIDPNAQYYTKSTDSNMVVTFIIMPSLVGTKAVDMSYATIGDTLNYSILYTNTGNTILTKMFLIDNLSNGGVFKTGTVIIDDISYPDYDPIVGFDLPDLIAGNTTAIKFQTTVALLPTPPQITNSATADGVYHIDPQGNELSISTTTNTVTTNINLGSLSNVKSVDKMYAKVGDTLTYTSLITNTGNVNATNIVFSDNLQPELTYIAGTVTIGGVLYPTLNPTAGFALANLAPNQSVTVAFEVSINALPVPPQVNNKSQVQFSYKINPNGVTLTNSVFSNLVTTQVVKGALNATKVVDKPIATIGDVLTYTVTLINVGNVIDNNVFFQDTPSIGATFKLGTVTVNGVSQSSYDPTVGFDIGDIGIGQVVTIVFKADVVSVPPSNKVTNQAVINFKFIVNPKEQPYSQTSYSNTVTTNIALGKLDVTKAVDKKFATIGDKLTYTVTIVNIGNIDATNVLFVDPTPPNSVFVPGTVTINGTPYIGYNPSAGFTLDTINPGQIVTVVYQVQVLNIC